MLGYVRGRLCRWDFKDALWRWLDTGEPAETWGGEARACPQCDKLPTPEGYDACLGAVEGASGACCGHGVHLGYVNWQHVSVGRPWWNRAYLVTDYPE